MEGASSRAALLARGLAEECPAKPPLSPANVGRVLAAARAGAAGAGAAGAGAAGAAARNESFDARGRARRRGAPRAGGRAAGAALRLIDALHAGPDGRARARDARPRSAAPDESERAAAAAGAERAPAHGGGDADGRVDERAECAAWAAAGECAANPRYMLASCARSCAAIASAAPGARRPARRPARARSARTRSRAPAPPRPPPRAARRCATPRRAPRTRVRELSRAPPVFALEAFASDAELTALVRWHDAQQARRNATPPVVCFKHDLYTREPAVRGSLLGRAAGAPADRAPVNDFCLDAAGGDAVWRGVEPPLSASTHAPAGARAPRPTRCARRRASTCRGPARVARVAVPTAAVRRSCAERADTRRLRRPDRGLLPLSLGDEA